MENKNFKLISICCVIFICVFLMIGVNYSKVVHTVNAKKTTKVILIDPGHGGVDGGAVSKNGIIEKNITLSIGLKLKEVLEKRNYEIMMTRETDTGLYSENKTIRQKKNEDLNNRCKMKAESGCDMFVCIHMNIFEQSKYYGAQVWYSNNEESKKIAGIIMQNFKERLDETNKRKEKPAGNSVKVLRCNDSMPGVLIECGFLSNPKEEALLKTDEYQQKIAELIADSIDKYYENNRE